MNSKDRRRLNIFFQIDTNRINASGRLASMNQLEEWHQKKIICIRMAQSAQEEASQGSRQRSLKASNYIYSMTMNLTQEEARLHQNIESILFPQGAATQNEKNDVDIVFNAKKYHCILVTNDGGSHRQPGGILGNREKLKTIGIEVMTDEEAVSFVKQRILKRDDCERERSRNTGNPLPNWVGID